MFQWAHTKFFRVIVAMDNVLYCDFLIFSTFYYFKKFNKDSFPYLCKRYPYFWFLSSSFFDYQRLHGC